MKNVFLLLVFSLFLSVNANTLKAGISQDYIPKGFYGSWGVISKLNSTNNPKLFNFESRDVWTLSGNGNVLVLENFESGAKSEYIVKDKTDGNTLKFEREKVVNKENGKVIYKEKISFFLENKNFSGTDNFDVETYDKNNKLITKDSAKYLVYGVRISGTSP